MTQSSEKPSPQIQVSDGSVSDSVIGNWVDRLAPAPTRPYLRLSRADRPIGTWLLLLPCFWGLALAKIEFPQSNIWHDIWVALACIFGAVLMRWAGCTWNDITDHDYDAKVARTKSRPLPSGQVTAKQALIWMGAQIVVSGAILLTLGPLAIALGIGSLILVAIYPFAKRFTWWPQVFLGLAFNWGVFVAAAAQSGHITPAIAILWLNGIAWTLFYDTIYAHQDKEDDALIGVKSTARLFGDSGTKPWLYGFLSAALLLGLAALSLSLPHLWSWQSALAFGGLISFGGHLSWQLRALDSQNPDLCLKLFRSNREAGLLFALFLALAAWG